jgi:hypothetical protein
MIFLYVFNSVLSVKWDQTLTDRLLMFFLENLFLSGFQMKDSNILTLWICIQITLLRVISLSLINVLS